MRIEQLETELGQEQDRFAESIKISFQPYYFKAIRDTMRAYKQQEKK